MSDLMISLQRLGPLLVRRADVAVAITLMAVVFMLVLPLPTWLVDALVATNIAVSALLLMVTMYLPSPLAFTTFPTVLLITTLFRLALSIATTRLILLQADAGHIIDAFGNFVVGGNLVVGLVVFLILTIVQFIVITKGAERVAEVAARFSLDGMPGKQMSIDADLRAGAIDMEEARLRRSRLEKASQLYGAMDGAIKFVKGDAIASIIIVFVNLGGGLLIGTLQRGLTASEAISIYSVLTVGDGLIAQIPALLISIAAGIIVTRVTPDDSKRGNVGRDIAEQLMAQPQALLVAGAVMLGFAAIPGMPAWVFAVMAAAAGTLGFLLMRTSTPVDSISARDPGAAPGRAESSPGMEREEDLNYPPIAPLMLELAPNLSVHMDSKTLLPAVRLVNEELFLELGVPLPKLHVRYNQSLPPDSYAVLVNELSAIAGTLRPDQLLVQESPDMLEVLDIPHEFSNDPGPAGYWVSNEHLERLAAQGVQALTMIQLISRNLKVALRRHARDFLGVQEVHFLIVQLKSNHPELVAELQRVIPAQRIAEVLERLVNEGVSIRNMRLVAGALIEWGAKERDVIMLTEHVRSAMRRQISHQHADRNLMLPVYLLTPESEDIIRDAIRQTSMGSYLSLDAEATSMILGRIKASVGVLPPGTQPPVILSSYDTRRYLRKIIEDDLYEIAVLSHQEISPDIGVHPLGRIDLS